MSSNFLDLSGFMAGSDLHLYITIAPPAAPLFVFNPHIVADVHIRPQQKLWRVTWTVKTGFVWFFLQSGWSMLIVPHIPLPVPGHPLEAANLATTIITSSSSPQLSVHKVTGMGNALLVCVISAINLDLNCGTPAWLTGKGLNFSTVKTTPTLGDYVSAAVGTVLNALYTSVTSAIPWNPVSIAVTGIQTLLDIADRFNFKIPGTDVPITDPITRKINKLVERVQKAVDGEPAPT